MNKEIILKANECLSCKTKPCQLGCPLNNDITGFIKYIKEKKYKEAFDLLSKTTALPSLCGLICPQDDQCQEMCVKKISYEPVKIGDLEAFIGKIALEKKFKVFSPKKSHHHVLVIGGGVASITCAFFLRKHGIKVTIIEKYDYLGGLLVHGIPEFRLSKKLVKKAIDSVLDLGIDVVYNKELGRDFYLNDVINKYDAIFLGIGANLSNKMNIEGEDLDGVYGGNEFLEYKQNIDFHDKTVIILGGGNVAMDLSRTIKRKNAKHVIVVYRKKEKDMKASIKEILDAKKDGVEFLFETNILNIQGNKKVEKIEVIKTESIIDNTTKKISLTNKKDSNYYIKCDYVITAIGSHADKQILQKLNLNLDKNGKIDIDGYGHTSNKKVFAGGDVAGCKGTVAWASRSGRNAAFEIIKYINNKTFSKNKNS